MDRILHNEFDFGSSHRHKRKHQRQCCERLRSFRTANSCSQRNFQHSLTTTGFNQRCRTFLPGKYLSIHRAAGCRCSRLSVDASARMDRHFNHRHHQCHYFGERRDNLRIGHQRLRTFCSAKSDRVTRHRFFVQRHHLRQPECLFGQQQHVFSYCFSKCC